MATTRAAPAERSAPAQAERVAPVVSTSSSRTALRGALPRTRTAGGRAIRCARRLPSWRPPPRDRQSLSCMLARSASASAISPVGSKPREIDRSGAAGTGTRSPLSRLCGASQWIRAPIRSATGRSRRNLRAATRSRATPSCGAEDQTRSRPGGPAPAMGWTAARRRVQRGQMTACSRQERPQAAHSEGTSATEMASSRLTPRSCGRAARTWRAECQKFVKPQCCRRRSCGRRCRRPESPREEARCPRAGSSRE